MSLNNEAQKNKSKKAYATGQKPANGKKELFEEERLNTKKKGPI